MGEVIPLFGRGVDGQPNSSQTGETIDSVNSMYRKPATEGYIEHPEEKTGITLEPVDPSPELPIAIVRLGDLVYPNIPSLSGRRFVPEGVYRDVKYLEGPLIPDGENVTVHEAEQTDRYPAGYQRDFGNGQGTFLLSLRQPLNGWEQPWVPVNDPRDYEWFSDSTVAN